MPFDAFYLYVGTYTRAMSFVDGRGAGIYTCTFDAGSGKLELVGETAAENPSYLAVHPSGRYLYAVSELSEVQQPTGDAIIAYALDRQSGVPRPLNQQPCLGGSPCHVALEASGKYAYVAAYAGGDVAAYPIGADGRLGAHTEHIAHVRAGKTAHAHSINPAPGGGFALACDLGLDRVIVYRLDLTGGRLLWHAELALAPGCGPRHLAFHPNQRVVYVLNELNATVDVLGWNATQGSLESIQAISTLPAGFSGAGWCADIHVHPNGRYVYASNRGGSSLAIYRVDPSGGELSVVGFESTRGMTPRSFVLDPQGKWLLAANQDSGDMAVFRVDGASGQLDYQASLAIPSPVCVKLAGS